MVEKKEAKKPKQVKLTKAAFDKRSAYGKRIKEIEIPELNDLMGIEEGVVVVTIQQIDLDTYLESTGEVTDQQRNLVEGVIEAASEKDMVKAETLKLINKSSPMLKHRLRIVEKGLKSPKLKSSDVLWLSQMYPFVVSNLANEILLLTQQGAVKKNSQD